MTTNRMIMHLERDIRRMKIRSLLTNSESRREDLAKQIHNKERMLDELRKMIEGNIEYR